MLIREQVPLAPLTTLGVGGPARFFIEAGTQDEVVEAVGFAHARQLPLFVLGGGSNLVVADNGFPGVVLKVGIVDVLLLTAANGEVIFDAGAGVDWDAFVAETIEAECAGLECLSGIPGTVGGTPVQNVGAYGQEVAETIREVRALDLRSLESKTLSNAECQFSYRSSLFNTTERGRGRYIILRVSFALRQGGRPGLRYAELQEVFANDSVEPTLAEVRAAVLEIRRRKGMLIVPGEDDSRSAGSFFKNPIVPMPVFTELAARMEAHGWQLPSYPLGEGFRKLPAAWLVELAGFPRGYSKGAAGISRRHALAIINRGGATAADIMALKENIQARVKDEFEIELQPEPVFVGF
ncbi:MAG: UDP-N-acetylmuramate dehydrogenase [Acidobacteriota bacterium]|nr:UDP-N-acetylmuramate dehydrogenase [Acidobacteriota bacterium]